ncbi:hypothetical protein BJ875DRAFT_87473 [Amylocarpus encephaloides]|uniref:Uncharacterized protein n=1 Tax=Amylocarpus encephaloides TaxID=45428 RepID=A0A9P8C962_9HELO|nr:hypothetical protein BJ875DRAFT_87473 [Amylocarpus encephaloides]
MLLITPFPPLSTSNPFSSTQQSHPPPPSSTSFSRYAIPRHASPSPPSPQGLKQPSPSHLEKQIPPLPLHPMGETSLQPTKRPDLRADVNATLPSSSSLYTSRLYSQALPLPSSSSVPPLPVPLPNLGDLSAEPREAWHWTRVGGTYSPVQYSTSYAEPYRTVPYCTVPPRAPFQSRSFSILQGLENPTASNRLPTDRRATRWGRTTCLPT